MDKNWKLKHLEHHDGVMMIIMIITMVMMIIMIITMVMMIIMMMMMSC